MGKGVGAILLFGCLLHCVVNMSGAEAKDKMTMIFHADLNKDGRKELLVHDFYGGSSGYGLLKIYNPHGRLIFKVSVEGDPYLFDPEKHRPRLNNDFFPDLDGDGIPEILVGHRGIGDLNEIHSHVDEPWWFDIYKWNGKTFALADESFPNFYHNELVEYRRLVQEKGVCESFRKFIKRAEKLEAKSL